MSSLDEARAFYGRVLGLDEAFTIRNPLGRGDLTTFKINDGQYVYVAPDLTDPNESRLLFVDSKPATRRACAHIWQARAWRCRLLCRRMRKGTFRCS